MGLLQLMKHSTHKTRWQWEMRSTTRRAKSKLSLKSKSGAYYTEKNEKWFCGKKCFLFSKRVTFFSYNMKQKNIFFIKWFFHIFHFASKPFLMSSGPKKNHFKKVILVHLTWKMDFLIHIIRKKSHFLRWKPLFGQNDFCQIIFFCIIWLFSFGKKIHFSCKMTFLFPSV